MENEQLIANHGIKRKELFNSDVKDLALHKAYSCNNIIKFKNHKKGALRSFLKQYSKNTQESYKSCLVLFFKRYNYMLLGTLKSSHIRNYIFDDLEESSAAYKAFTKSTLDSFFDFLIVEGALSINPVKPIRTPKIDINKKSFDVPTDEEVYMIIDAFNNYNHKVLTEILYVCALRISEALSIRFSDFKKRDDESYSALVLGKGNKSFNLKITSNLYSKLKLVERESVDGPLFPTPRNLGKSITRKGFSLELNKAVKKAGIYKNIGPHKFRSAAAEELVKRGDNILDIKSFMRHSSINTTMRYITNYQAKDLHFSLEKSIKEINNFNVG